MGTEKTSGRVVVITGGFGALGQVVATAAIEHGFSVAVLGHAAQHSAGLPRGWGRRRSCSAVSISPTKQLRLP
jgi:NAD(P)-dependent dehydrogenase (short-subunit alcohol dehydrogenase family)